VDLMGGGQPELLAGPPEGGGIDTGTIYSPDTFYSDDIAPRQEVPPAWMHSPDALGDAPSWMQGMEEPSGLSRFTKGLGEFGSKMGAGLEKEFTGSPLGAFSKMLGLGVAGMNVSNQFAAADRLDRQQRLAERGQATAQAAAQPAVDFGKESLENARAGRLPEAMESVIERWKEKARADWRAKLAHMKITDSTSMQQVDDMIEQMALSLRGSMLSDQSRSGVQALQVGANAGVGATGIAQQQQAALTEMIAAADKQLAALAAGQS
jgi:hypothetical protein